MKSKRTTEALSAKLAWLRQQHAEITQQTDKMWKEIEAWPVQTVEVDGRTFKGRTIVNAQTDRAYDDLMRRKGHIEHEIRQLESWVSPPKGRPKGRRNERPWPDDPTMEAALQDWKNSPEPKPRLRKLAFEHCPVKTEDGRKKWIYRFKKFKQKARHPQS